MEANKGRRQSRSIVTAEVSAEQVCFPVAEQPARLLRQTQGRQDEQVALIKISGGNSRKAYRLAKSGVACELTLSCARCACNVGLSANAKV
jgi:hypothetical protein